MDRSLQHVVLCGDAVMPQFDTSRRRWNGEWSGPDCQS
jgi:hypothetical protein